MAATSIGGSRLTCLSSPRCTMGRRSHQECKEQRQPQMPTWAAGRARAGVGRGGCSGVDAAGHLSSAAQPSEKTAA